MEFDLKVIKGILLKYLDVFILIFFCFFSVGGKFFFSNMYYINVYIVMFFSNFFC